MVPVSQRRGAEPDAQPLLDRRGVKEEVLGEARGLLEQIGSLEEDEPGDHDEALDEEAQAAAEARLWAWYLEWSAIARSAIRDRRLLRTLGFLRTTRRADGTLVDEVVEDEEAEEDEAVVVTPAGRADPHRLIPRPPRSPRAAAPRPPGRAFVRDPHRIAPARRIGTRSASLFPSSIFARSATEEDMNRRDSQRAQKRGNLV